MKRIMIGCQVLEQEINTVLQLTGVEIPVIIMPMELHTFPNKLREELQKQINQLSDYDQILLTYGSCGNAIIGLQATHSDLIIPKVDDCIHMLLCKDGKQFERAKYTYFLSQGWLQSDKGFFEEYPKMKAKYGEARAKRLFQKMIAEYKYLMLIDTGIIDQAEMQRMVDQAQKYAKMADLELTLNQGSIWLLEKMLLNQIDYNFIVVKKGQTVEMSAFHNQSNIACL